jgi:hypothetical protein
MYMTLKCNSNTMSVKACAYLSEMNDNADTCLKVLTKSKWQFAQAQLRTNIRFGLDQNTDLEMAVHTASCNWMLAKSLTENAQKKVEAELLEHASQFPVRFVGQASRLV